MLRLEFLVKDVRKREFGIYSVIIYKIVYNYWDFVFILKKFIFVVGFVFLGWIMIVLIIRFLF